MSKPVRKAVTEVKPVWMEDWTTEERGDSLVVKTPDNEGRFGLHLGAGSDCCGYYADLDQGRADTERTRLAAAAPALARALLAAEWAADPFGERSCPSCDYGISAEPHHAHECATHQALTTAGFPDQAVRDEARRILAEKK